MIASTVLGGLYIYLELFSTSLTMLAFTCFSSSFMSDSPCLIDYSIKGLGSPLGH